MSKLESVSRLARSMSEIIIHSEIRKRMEFAVVTALEVGNSITAATDIGRALGCGVIYAGLPTPASDITAADFGRSVSDRLAMTAGPAILLLLATEVDGGDRQRQVVEGIARLARDAWSVNGQTFLMIVAPRDHHAALARLAGEAIGRHDWAGAIAL